MKMRASVAAVFVVLGTSLGAVPAFGSSPAPAPATRVLAQATPCVIGEVCDNPSNQPGTLPGANLPKPKEIPGKNIRSLVVMAIMVAAFSLYLRWALRKNTIY